MSSETTPAELFEADRAFLLAPAGCGKTEVIARAVALTPDGDTQLVLTHTHAGVDALRSRMRRLRVSPSSYRIDTIAGFCLRTAASYPTTSGLSDFTPTGSSWNEVYGAAVRVLAGRLGERILTASYSGVFVDEYQDCTRDQHEVTRRLAEVLPTRIVGDPLQGIFGFGDQELVDWDVIADEFRELPSLTTPWRWVDANPALGRWLLGIRSSLSAGERLPIPDGAPVQVLDGSREALHVLACHRVAQQNGSVVGVRKWPRDAHATAMRLGGRFTSMEEMDCNDLRKLAKQLDELDETQGTDKALTVLEFATRCMTKVSTLMSTARKRLSQGDVPTTRKGSVTASAVRALADFATSGSPAQIEPVLNALERMPKVKVYRRELLREMKRTARAVVEGEFENFADAAWAVRDRARHTGRSPARRVISRTLLIKGLEFDHAVVLDPYELDAKHLYVALTRGARSLTVLTNNAERTVRYEGASV